MFNPLFPLIASQSVSSGIVKVQQGPLAGEVIPFLSSCTWLLGRHMGKADLSYVFVAGGDNTVTVEAVKNARYEPGMPRYFASMVYNTFMRRPLEVGMEYGF